MLALCTLPAGGTFGNTDTGRGLQGKARLGQVVHKKTAACCALVSVKNEDQRELAQIVETCKSNYNNVKRTAWGGGIMGPKSQHRTLKRDRAIAKEQEKRNAVA